MNETHFGVGVNFWNSRFDLYVLPILTSEYNCESA